MSTTTEEIFEHKMASFLSVLREAILTLDKNRIENIYSNQEYKNLAADAMFNGLYSSSLFAEEICGLNREGYDLASIRNNELMMDYFLDKISDSINAQCTLDYFVRKNEDDKVKYLINKNRNTE